MIKILKNFKKIFIIILVLHLIAAGILGSVFLLKGKNNKDIMVMGAVLLKNEKDTEDKKVSTNEENMTEKYFRPSKLPVLNNRKEASKIIEDYFNEKPSDIALPKELTKTPYDAVINYFSILQEAENLPKDKMGGCGTIGWEKQPYPIAYNFLSSKYKSKVDYNTFLKSFENIAHINLIKAANITNELTGLGKIKYFVEMETIEGSDKGNTYFGYYYGFIDIEKEKDTYRISNMEFTGEDFLCAAYHGWRHNAEAYVDIVYGDWCKLIKKRLPTTQEGYIKNIEVNGTDGKDYKFVFMNLTNGTDVEVSQFVKDKDNTWKAIKINPENCLKK